MDRIGIASGVFGTVYRERIYRYPNAFKEMYQEIEGSNVIEYENEFHEIMAFTNSHKNIISIFEITILNTNSLLITMELMKTNLTMLLEEDPCLALDKSISILCDVSSAIHYLHSQRPAMFHGNLHSENVFLTPNLLAKVGDIMPQKLMQKCINEGVIRAFSPRRILDRSIESLDIFAFGLIVSHVFSKKYPKPKMVGSFDHKLREVERYQEYLDLIKNEQCKDLVFLCLSSNPPHSLYICKRMTRIKEDVSESRIEGHRELNDIPVTEGAMPLPSATWGSSSLGKVFVMKSGFSESGIEEVKGLYKHAMLQLDSSTKFVYNASKTAANKATKDSAFLKLKSESTNSMDQTEAQLEALEKDVYSLIDNDLEKKMEFLDFNDSSMKTTGQAAAFTEAQLEPLRPPTSAKNSVKKILEAMHLNVSQEKNPDVSKESATTNNKYSDSKPEMIHLIKFVIPKIQAVWDDVAFALKYEFHTVRAIQEKYNEDPRKCCKWLLGDWLTTRNGKSPKTWSTLLDALRELDDLTGVIHEIEEDYSNLQ